MLESRLVKKPEEIVEEIKAIRTRSEKTATHLENNLYRLAEMLTRKAGLDPYCMTQHLHNANVGRLEGRPWPNVDYALADLARFVLKHLVYLPRDLSQTIFDLQCLADPAYPEFSRQGIIKKLTQQED